jgi:D-glycero-D-manno-heptose 1,7-bisphosphate phosphatase
VPVEIVEEIHHRMLAEIAQVGGVIEKIYYCPHSKDENCFCRKPRPGMLLRARDDLGIDMKDAIFIGDSITDVRAGMAAGVGTVLVLTGLGMRQLREHSHEADGPFYIAMSLKHVAECILQMADWGRDSNFAINTFKGRISGKFDLGESCLTVCTM